MPQTVYGVSEGKKFNTDTTLVAVTCASCKILYAIPQSLYNSAQKYPGTESNGWDLCCPLGHTWHYVGESEEKRLARELEAERNRAARLSAAHDQAAQDARVQKGLATRFRNDRDRIKARAEAGVCPHCKRTFSQLAVHIKHQHPDCSH